MPPRRAFIVAKLAASELKGIGIELEQRIQVRPTMWRFLMHHRSEVFVEGKSAASVAARGRGKKKAALISS